MNAFGRGALEKLAILWIVFGGLGSLVRLASHPENAYPGWQWTIAVSVALVVGGIGTLRRQPGARWIAAAAVAGGLAEAAVWLLWMWTPILIATAAFHAYGLVVLVVTEFRLIPTPAAPPPVSRQGLSSRTSKEASQ